MALFYDGCVCAICHKPLIWEQDLLGFTFVGSRHPLVQMFDDSICHRDCMSRWEHRDEFVKAWNHGAMDGLGPHYFLELTPSGDVRYLSWFGRQLYRVGWKRSPLLPTIAVYHQRRKESRRRWKERRQEKK